MDHADNDSHFWRRHLHRWFVEFNPFYLVSATLCLAGLRLLSRGLAEHGSVFGDLGVGAITELYAAALIGGAALLTRIGQRRPGVMLALLAAVYQGDLALHTEACTYLGGVGIAASAVWSAIFIAKLYALAWAVRLRPSRSAFAIVAYAGLGLAVIPQLVTRWSDGPRNALVALWLYSLAALALMASRHIASAVDLDAWGRTVLRRALRAFWLGGALLIALHVAFWSMTLSVDLGLLVPAGLLLGTHLLRRESSAWTVITGVLACVALTMPHAFSVCALLAAATLALRAYRHLQVQTASPLESMTAPFRAEHNAAMAPVAMRVWVFAPAATGAQRRLLVGALFASYLALWTMGWSGGPWPMHVPWLDLALTATVLWLATRMRVRVALPPLAMSYAHLLIQRHVVTAPRTTLEWGAVFTSSAFALLLASLATSYALRGMNAVITAPGSREAHPPE